MSKILVIVAVLCLTFAFTGIISSVEAYQYPSKIDLQQAQSKIISNYKNAIQDCNSLECKQIARLKYSNQIKQQLREFTINKRLIEW